MKDPISYYASIATPPLPPKEREAMLAKCRSPDANEARAAEDVVLRSVVKLVMRIAGQLAGNDAARIAEYIEIGMIEAMKAIRIYDHSRGAFTTICGKCVRMGIFHHITHNGRLKRSASVRRIDECESMLPHVRHDVSHVDAKIDIDDVMRRLNPTNIDIIRKHYGIGCVPMTGAEIAREKGVSRQFVSIETIKALKFMREQLERKAGA